MENEHKSHQDRRTKASIGGDPLGGSCKSKFAYIHCSSDFVQSLLPDELEPAQQPYTKPDRHPVLLMFNDTHLHRNPVFEKIAIKHRLELKLHYNEFVVCFPYVQFKEGTISGSDYKGPYIFLPVLYLDSLLAVIGGRLFWEFNKELARFHNSDGVFDIHSEILNRRLIRATAEVSGKPGSIERFPNFDKMSPILNLPVVEQGIYGYVSSTYTIDYQGVDITPFAMTIDNIGSKYLPKGRINEPGINDSPFGAFHINYNWSLSFIKFITF